MNREHRYLIGLDLGQLQDYTAVTVIKEHGTWKPVRRYGQWDEDFIFEAYHLQHLERFPLGTPYPAVAARVKALQDTPPLNEARVVADATGVGRPVIEMLKEAGVRHLCPVTITGGQTATYQDGGHHVPKRDLVTNLQVLVQNETLKFAEGLPLADVLRSELQMFRAKINLDTGKDSYEAWRERDHDDVVLSLALACWYAERGPKSPRGIGMLVNF